MEGPRNLYAPVQGYDRVEGDFGDQAKSTSLYTWLEWRPQARTILTSAVALGGALLLGRALRGPTVQARSMPEHA